MAISCRPVFARFIAIALVATTASLPRLVTAQGALKAHQQLARDIYKELVEINTTDDAVRRHDAGGRGDGGALAGRGLPGRRRPGPERRPARRQPRRALSRHGGERKPSCCSRISTSSTRRRDDWTHRSVHVHGEGRLLLRPRHRRRQGDGRDLDREPDPDEAGGLRSRPRPHPRAHGRRRGRRSQRRRVAAREHSAI